jgi:hypothetical protein
MKAAERVRDPGGMSRVASTSRSRADR